MRLKVEGKIKLFAVCYRSQLNIWLEYVCCDFIISQLMHMQCRLIMSFLCQRTCQKLLGIMIILPQCTGLSSLAQGTLCTAKKLFEAPNEFPRKNCLSLWLNPLRDTSACQCHSFTTPRRWKTDHTLHTFVLVPFVEAHRTSSTSDMTMNHRI